MTRAGVSEEVMVTHIQTRGMVAPLQSPDLIVLQREQHLSALDGLAAAAAHELGTPLATIALVANELAREMKPDDPHAEDVQLLKAQSQRCRDIFKPHDPIVINRQPCDFPATFLEVCTNARDGWMLD